MEEPRFHFPLNETGLLLVGRIVLAWSQVEWFTDRIIEKIYKFDRYQLIALTGDKQGRLDLLTKSLDFITDPGLRAETKAFADTMSGLKSDRNAIIHGMWGYHNPDHDTYIAAAISHKRPDGLVHSELVRIHNAVCAETRRAVRIYSAMGGPQFPETQINFYYGPTLPPREPTLGRHPNTDRSPGSAGH